MAFCDSDFFDPFRGAAFDLGDIGVVALWRSGKLCGVAHTVTSQHERLGTLYHEVVVLVQNDSQGKTPEGFDNFPTKGGKFGWWLEGPPVQIDKIDDDFFQGVERPNKIPYLMRRHAVLRSRPVSLVQRRFLWSNVDPDTLTDERRGQKSLYYDAEGVQSKKHGFWIEAPKDDGTRRTAYVWRGVSRSSNHYTLDGFTVRERLDEGTKLSKWVKDAPVGPKLWLKSEVVVNSSPCSLLLWP